VEETHFPDQVMPILNTQVCFTGALSRKFIVCAWVHVHTICGVLCIW